MEALYFLILLAATDNPDAFILNKNFHIPIRTSLESNYTPISRTLESDRFIIEFTPELKKGLDNFAKTNNISLNDAIKNRDFWKNSKQDGIYSTKQKDSTTGKTYDVYYAKVLINGRIEYVSIDYLLKEEVLTVVNSEQQKKESPQEKISVYIKDSDVLVAAPQETEDLSIYDIHWPISDTNITQETYKVEGSLLWWQTSYNKDDEFVKITKSDGDYYYPLAQIMELISPSSKKNDPHYMGVMFSSSEIAPYLNQGQKKADDIKISAPNYILGIRKDAIGEADLSEFLTIRNIPLTITESDLVELDYETEYIDDDGKLQTKIRRGKFLKLGQMPDNQPPYRFIPIDEIDGTSGLKELIVQLKAAKKQYEGDSSSDSSQIPQEFSIKELKDLINEAKTWTNTDIDSIGGIQASVFDVFKPVEDTSKEQSVDISIQNIPQDLPSSTIEMDYPVTFTDNDGNQKTEFKKGQFVKVHSDDKSTFNYVSLEDITRLHSKITESSMITDTTPLKTVSISDECTINPIEVSNGKSIPFEGVIELPDNLSSKTITYTEGSSKTQKTTVVTTVLHNKTEVLLNIPELSDNKCLINENGKPIELSIAAANVPTVCSPSQPAAQIEPAQATTLKKHIGAILNEIDNKPLTRTSNEIIKNIKETCCKNNSDKNACYNNFMDFLKNESKYLLIPVEVALSVIAIESRGRCSALNKKDNDGSRGLFQVNGSDKFSGDEWQDFETNTLKGLQILRSKFQVVNKKKPQTPVKAWKDMSRSEKDLWGGALSAYNGGEAHVLNMKNLLNSFNKQKGTTLKADNWPDLRFFAFYHELKNNALMNVSGIRSRLRNGRFRSTATSKRNVNYASSIINEGGIADMWSKASY